MKRTIPFLAAAVAATFALPVHADEACAAAPTPECLLATAEEIGNTIEDEAYRNGVLNGVQMVQANPTVLHGSLMEVYIDPSHWLDGRLGEPEDAADAARALFSQYDKAVALIGLGRHWTQPELIFEGVAVVNDAPEGSFEPASVQRILFTAVVELLRMDMPTQAHDVALSAVSPIDRAAILAMMASVMTPPN